MHNKTLTLTPPTIVFQICILVVFSIEIVNLNLKTAEDMFTNFGLSIIHHQTVCKEQEPNNHLHFS